jgi:hypothetical protein
MLRVILHDTLLLRVASIGCFVQEFGGRRSLSAGIAGPSACHSLETHGHLGCQSGSHHRFLPPPRAAAFGLEVLAAEMMFLRALLWGSARS